MPQIVKVSLRGFQSHTDSVIYLGPGLNVITGPSGTGKTAIIRAVKWVVFNEPTGEAFVNKKTGEAEVVIALDNGVEVKKLRKSGKTRYWVTGFDEPFEKAEVPLEVTQALGIEKQTFGDFVTALNFAFQLDAPFIISETASAGAKILGKIAGTEVVDMAIKDVGKDTHQARTDRSAAEKEVAKINGDLLAYNDLDDIRKQVEASSYMISVIDETLGRRDRLEAIHSDYVKTLERIYKEEGILAELENVPAAQALLTKIDGTNKTLERLQLLQADYDYARTSFDMWKREVEKLQNVEAAADIMEVINSAGQRLASLRSLSTVYASYTQQKADADKTLQKLGNVDGLAAKLSTIEYDQIRAARLKGVASEWDYNQKLLQGAEARLEALNMADDIQERISQTEAAYQRIMALKSLRTMYRLGESDLRTTQQHLDEAESDVARADYELNRVWEEAGGICPLCDQPHERTEAHA